MAKILTLDEMLEVIRREEWPGAAFFSQALELIGTEMGRLIAERLGISASEAKAEGLAFAGTCAAFAPKQQGQACPEQLADLDPSADWEFGSRDVWVLMLDGQYWNGNGQWTDNPEYACEYTAEESKLFAAENSGMPGEWHQIN